MAETVLPPLQGEWVLHTQVDQYGPGAKNQIAGAITVDPGSIQTHSSGWEDANAKNDPGAYYAFSAFKGLVIYRLLEAAPFMGKYAEVIAKSAGAAVATGAVSDSISVQRKVDGKSVVSRQWYGEIGIAVTLRGLRLAYASYRGSGPPSRGLIELTVSYRVVGPTGQEIKSFPPDMIPPFQKMEDFLASVKSNSFPTRNIDYRTNSSVPPKYHPSTQSVSPSQLLRQGLRDAEQKFQRLFPVGVPIIFSESSLYSARRSNRLAEDYIRGILAQNQNVRSSEPTRVG
jgi:hypothetical protein